MITERPDYQQSHTMSLDWYLQEDFGRHREPSNECENEGKMNYCCQTDSYTFLWQSKMGMMVKQLNLILDAPL